jgi:hypothetical protein
MPDVYPFSGHLELVGFTPLVEGSSFLWLINILFFCTFETKKYEIFGSVLIKSQGYLGPDGGPTVRYF